MEIEEVISNLRSIYGMILFLDTHQKAFPIMNDKKVSDVFQECIESLEQKYVTLEQIFEEIHNIFDPEENYPIKEDILRRLKAKKVRTR